MDKVTAITMFTLLGFFTGAGVAIEAKEPVQAIAGLLICVFTIGGATIAMGVSKKQKRNE